MDGSEAKQSKAHPAKWLNRRRVAQLLGLIAILVAIFQLLSRHHVWPF